MGLAPHAKPLRIGHDLPPDAGFPEKPSTLVLVPRLATQKQSCCCLLTARTHHHVRDGGSFDSRYRLKILRAALCFFPTVLCGYQRHDNGLKLGREKAAMWMIGNGLFRRVRHAVLVRPPASYTRTLTLTLTLPVISGDSLYQSVRVCDFALEWKRPSNSGGRYATHQLHCISFHFKACPYGIRPADNGGIVYRVPRLHRGRMPRIMYVLGQRCTEAFRRKGGGAYQKT
ncbi:uncharacterized protein BDZ83DRAFT_726718 [Colletotrichum acutatum]|uniref:Uncharacterized protein n=1 Tax=Glomerella acutata TaxID=27357 RepID=A0AAD9D1I9_GLOAC|nr:uncharacterized protein BDZ83DRAFT_726718 [Colletotrichum acutatum]KAK1730074.1 hypothetical protein BDZ83DRAFT_726718 [Colletotrichum acutatum]